MIVLLLAYAVPCWLLCCRSEQRQAYQDTVQSTFQSRSTLTTTHRSLLSRRYPPRKSLPYLVSLLSLSVFAFSVTHNGKPTAHFELGCLFCELANLTPVLSLLSSRSWYSKYKWQFSYTPRLLQNDVFTFRVGFQLTSVNHSHTANLSKTKAITEHLLGFKLMTFRLPVSDSTNWAIATVDYEMLYS